MEELHGRFRQCCTTKRAWRSHWACVSVLLSLSPHLCWGSSSSEVECDDVDLDESCSDFYASAKSWSVNMDLQDAINSFTVYQYGNEEAFPPTERTKEGIFLVPGLEARIAKKPGCTFAGEVIISQSEDCSVDPHSPPQVEELENADTNNFRFLLGLPQARQAMFLGSPSTKFKDLIAQEVNLRLFFCVRSGPAEDLKALHILWYFQSAKQEGTTSIWEAPHAKLHPDLKLQSPQVWREEERYRMSPVKLEATAGIAMTSVVPHYSYTLMHFQAKAFNGDGPLQDDDSAAPRHSGSLLAVAGIIVSLSIHSRTIASLSLPSFS